MSKIKDTLHSKTLKGGYNKVFLLFVFLWQRSQDVAISCFKPQYMEFMPSLWGEIDNFSAPGTKK